MVAIIMCMRVLVFKRHVPVLMGMSLRQMEGHTGQHQRRARANPDRDVARVQREGDAGPDEGGEREHRTSARGTELALRQ